MSLQGVCVSSQVFLSEGFVWGFFVWKVLSGVDFVRPLLSEHIRYNRKLNITFNFWFHMYEFFLNVMSHALGPPPLSQTVTPSRTPSPSSVMYFMDGPYHS